MLNKQLWGLVLRAMIAIGVQNDLRVRQVLLKDKRVHRMNDHVVAAVHHQRGLSDLLQISIGIFRPLGPSGPRWSLQLSNIYMLISSLLLNLIKRRALMPAVFSSSGSGGFAGLGYFCERL